MSGFNVGDKIFLTRGTRVGLDSGEKFEWGGTKYDWFVVGEGDAECLVDIDFTIVAQGPCHATMNGGGFDWTLEDPTGIRATVRTTFNRDARQTFVKAEM